MRNRDQQLTILSSIFENGSLDHPRAKHTDAHARRGSFDAKRSGKTDNSVFRGGVADTPRSGHQTGHGRGVDKVAKSLAKHHWISRLNAVHDATQVYIQDLIPILDLIEPDFAANADAALLKK